MRDININNYAKLSPIERINLTISSLARGDFKEADRLWDTCPKFTYKSPDLDYTIRLMAINNIKSIFFGECVCSYNHLVRIDNVINLIETIALDLTNQNHKKLDKLYSIRNDHLINLKALFKGFLEFCCEIGLNGNQLLATLYIQHTCFEINSYIDSDANVTQLDINTTKAMFFEYWDF